MVAETAYAACSRNLVQVHSHFWEARLDNLPPRTDMDRVAPLSLAYIGLGIADVLDLYTARRGDAAPVRLLLIDWHQGEEQYYAVGLNISRKRRQRLERYRISPALFHRDAQLNNF